jgi:hypothetical protein
MDQQQQPQWSPPPQQPTGWGGPGYGGPPMRPTGVTLASIYLIVMGVLIALAGAACGLFAGAAGSIASQDTSGLLGGLGMGLAVIGIILLVLGIASIAAGAGALGGKGWARWTGVIVSVLMVILGVLAILGSMSGVGQNMTSLVFWLIVTVAYALTAWALISANAFFSARR